MRRIALTLLVTVTALVVLPVLPANAADDRDRDGCKDIIFMGVRGSSQDWGATANDPNLGMGPQVFQTLRRYKEITTATVDGVGIPYPAVAASNAVTNPDAYTSSVRQAVDNLKSRIRVAADACPSSRIVVVGYSQGAHAVHLLPNELLAMPAKYNNAVDALLTIGDPSRVNANEGVRDFTAQYIYNVWSNFADKGYGILARYFGIGPGRGFWDPDVPSSFLNNRGLIKMASMCYDADPICNPDSGLPQLAILRTLEQVNSGYHAAYSNQDPSYCQARYVRWLLTRQPGGDPPPACQPVP